MIKSDCITHALFLLLILCNSIQLCSQSKVRFLEVGLGSSHRSGLFESDQSNTRFTAEVSFLKQLRLNQPLFWGINSYYFTLGTRSSNIDVLSNFGFEEQYFSTTSNLWGNSAFLRFYPDIYLGKFELFIEAHFGFKYLFTMTSRSLDSESDVSEYISESHDLSMTYGAFFGVQYPIKEKLYLKTSLGYLPGISAQYFIKNNNTSIIDSTIEGFDLQKSSTDIYRISLGVTYRF